MSTAIPEPTSRPVAAAEEARLAVQAHAQEPTIGRLVSDATEQVSSILRNEIALAKKEISVDVKKGGIGAGFLAGAGVFALFGLMMLLHSFAWGITELMDDKTPNACAGYGIIAILLFIGAAILGLMGKKKISTVNGKPERTIETTKETIDTVKAAAKS